VLRFEFKLSPGQGNSPLFGDWPFGPLLWKVGSEAWWLATTNRWLTTPAPWWMAPGLDQTGSPQSVQRTLEKPVSVTLRGFSAVLKELLPETPKGCPPDGEQPLIQRPA